MGLRGTRVWRGMMLMRHRRGPVSVTLIRGIPTIRLC